MKNKIIQERIIPYGRQAVRQEDIDAVVSVLRSDYLTQGPVVPKFENVVAASCNAGYGVAANSATSALHIACLSLGVSQGDLVWTSPNSFVASANCALYCGAKVDFVDIDPQTSNMCPLHLEQKLEKAKKTGALPKVVIPVHFAGQPCEMSTIYSLGQKYGFHIIEDASHAIGSIYKNTKTGAGLFSDITVFSFHPVKIITTGEGGMALTNNLNLAERMRRFRTHGITSMPEQMNARPTEEIWNYQQIDLGHNYRMNDIQGALGISQMGRLEEHVRLRHAVANRYANLLKNLPILTPKQQLNSYSSYHLYPIRVRSSLCGKSQKQIYNFFQMSKINVNLHYIPIYRQPYYERLGFRSGYCPEAENHYKETISLPIYPDLTTEDIDHIIDVLSQSLK